MADGLTAAVEGLLERQDDYIDDTFEILTGQYSSAVRDAVDDLRQIIDDLDTGELDRFEADATDIAQARIQSRESFTAVEAIWDRWSERLDRIENFPLEVLSTVEDRDVPFAAQDRTLIQELRGQWPDADDPTGSGLAGRFYNLSEHHRRELADSVTRHVFGRARRSELVDHLAEQLDAAEWQAEQMFRDSTIQFSRSVNAHKAEELGYEFFQYFGPIDSITRPFCRPLVGNIYSKTEIENMDNGQTGDVMTSGGGYNCRHRWVPVRREMFSDEEWERLRDE